MESKQAQCVGGRHKLETFDLVEYETVNPRLPKIDKVKMGKRDFCGRSKSQLFTK